MNEKSTRIRKALFRKLVLHGTRVSHHQLHTARRLQKKIAERGVFVRTGNILLQRGLLTKHELMSIGQILREHFSKYWHLQTVPPSLCHPFLRTDHSVTVLYERGIISFSSLSKLYYAKSVLKRYGFEKSISELLLDGGTVSLKTLRVAHRTFGPKQFLPGTTGKKNQQHLRPNNPSRTKSLFSSVDMYTFEELVQNGTLTRSDIPPLANTVEETSRWTGTKLGKTLRSLHIVNCPRDLKTIIHGALDQLHSRTIPIKSSRFHPFRFSVAVLLPLFLLGTSFLLFNKYQFPAGSETIHHEKQIPPSTSIRNDMSKQQINYKSRPLQSLQKDKKPISSRNVTGSAPVNFNRPPLSTSGSIREIRIPVKVPSNESDTYYLSACLLGPDGILPRSKQHPLYLGKDKFYYHRILTRDEKIPDGTLLFCLLKMNNPLLSEVFLDHISREIDGYLSRFLTRDAYSFTVPVYLNSRNNPKRIESKWYHRHLHILGGLAQFLDVLKSGSVRHSLFSGNMKKKRLFLGEIFRFAWFQYHLRKTVLSYWTGYLSGNHHRTCRRLLKALYVQTLACLKHAHSRTDFQSSSNIKINTAGILRSKILIQKFRNTLRTAFYSDRYRLNPLN